ncbi:SAM-dependent methyltransferase [Nocardia transvalensis]|uniref:SAM-dependent methyltransferase n=1 Tax=Nocardia transvalensis TaxID=37333 RepID=A0A7W9PI80_9NOCA|nr:class I SAM-dependent methyltransferase [Nocardia transvalensis]MBB5916657.1 SAM-dependent methyltransferase [Nocardia transvalensis]
MPVEIWWLGMELSFQEKDDRLADRIRANKLFADFDLSAWLGGYVSARRWRALLDLGCGNGNHLGLYLAAAADSDDRRVVGLDRDSALLAAAAQRYAGARGLELVAGSMDDPLPFPGESFDLVNSVFAVYNAADADRTLRELHRVLTPGGHLLLIGPTADNARELYVYNERLTGQRIDDRTAVRAGRLVTEFLPLVRELFAECSDELLGSYVTFPNQEEFLRYYRSTLLYEETAEGKVSDAEMTAACAAIPHLRLTKQTLVITARK